MGSWNPSSGADCRSVLMLLKRMERFPELPAFSGIWLWRWVSQKNWELNVFHRKAHLLLQKPSAGIRGLPSLAELPWPALPLAAPAFMWPTSGILCSKSLLMLQHTQHSQPSPLNCTRDLTFTLIIIIISTSSELKKKIPIQSFQPDSSSWNDRSYMCHVSNTPVVSLYISVTSSQLTRPRAWYFHGYHFANPRLQCYLYHRAILIISLILLPAQNHLLFSLLLFLI